MVAHQNPPRETLLGDDIAAVKTAPSSKPDSEPMPIAVIGMACRFPGDANSPEKLWKLVSEGRNAWSPLNAARFNPAAWYHPDERNFGTTNVKGAHYLSGDIEYFDAPFFNFTADVAGTMGPEIRLQLETVYEAFENAGLPIEQVAGSNTSVYSGTFFRDSHDSQLRDLPTMDNTFMITGTGAAMVANRVSHFYDLRGPSVMVDTGCSTSLTTLHLACQSLRSGESTMSIVGGSGLLLNADAFIGGTKLGTFSPEGKCFAFDSRANGYGRGDGVGAVLLKPFADAVRDGDPIRAVIRNTSANQDGKTGTITAPSAEAQIELMTQCYQSAGLDPVDSGYVEAHGTGTATGDPIEAKAIGFVFGEKRHIDNPILMGSIKTNIGHTEAASGVASLIKVVLALEKGQIPPHVNYEKGNPGIPLRELKLQIPRSLKPWPENSLKRASVNNFGYGGANAHAIVEHPSYLLSKKFSSENSQSRVESRHPDRSRIFVWSAKDKHTVEVIRGCLQEYLSKPFTETSEQLLDQLAFTLGSRRSRFQWTMTCAQGTVEDLRAALDTASSGEVQPASSPRRASGIPRLGFVFSGQGAQWHAMGRELISLYPVFKNVLLRAEKCLLELGANWSLMEELLRDEATTNVNEVLYSLPMSVAIQLALIELLRSWSINPTCVTGHSSGEVSAAYAAGAVSFKAALAIVYCRGDLTTKISKLLNRNGTMIAVGLGRKEAEDRISRIPSDSGELMVACVNSPNSVTVSGDIPAIHDLEVLLHDENIFARRLKVSAAYHSHHMIPIAEPYHAALEPLLEPTEPMDGSIIFSSPTTGRRVDDLACLTDPGHWVRNMVQPVEFLDCLTHIRTPCRPGGPIKQILMQPELKGLGITYASTLNRGHSAISSIHSLVCSLVQQGYPVDLNMVNFPFGQPQHLKVLTDLPPYPWNHQTRYWKEPRINQDLRKRSHPFHDLLGTPAYDFSPLTPHWRWCIRHRDIPWVRDHVIQGSVIFPGAGYITMAIEAIRQTVRNTTEISGYKFEAINIVQALVLEDRAEGTEIRLSIRPCVDRIHLGQGWNDFHIQSLHSSGKWIVHCEGRVGVTKGVIEHSFIRNEVAASVSKDASLGDKVDGPLIYESLNSIGLSYGPTFQNQISSQQGDGFSKSVIRIADTVTTMPYQYQRSHIIHPTTLDTIFQAVFHNLPSSAPKKAMVPTTIRAMFVSAKISNKPGDHFEMTSTLNVSKTQGFESSAALQSTGPMATEDSNLPLLIMNGLYCQAVGGGAAMTNADQDKLCFTTTWKPEVDMLKPSKLTFSGRDRLTAIGSTIELLCHKLPMANIIEVGADKGEFTHHIQNALMLSKHIGRFDVTAPLAETVDAIRTSLDGADKIGFHTFKLDDSNAQGLELASYDLVIVSASVYESQNLEQAMGNLRRLLKPRGRIMVRGSPQSNDMLSESFKQSGNISSLRFSDDTDISSAALFEQQWAGVLQRADFENIFIEEDLTVANAASQEAKPQQEAVGSSTLAIVYSTAKIPARFLEQLSKGITDKFNTLNVSFHRLDEITNLPGNAFVIFLGDLAAPFLHEPTAQEFNQLKLMLSRFRRVLWLSQGSQIDCPNPFMSLHHGLLRTLRCEDTTRRFVSLDLDPAVPTWEVVSINHITYVLGVMLKDDLPLPDTEYAVRSDILQIPRIYQDFKQNNDVASSVSRQLPEMRPFSNSGMDLKLTSTARGMLQNLTFVHDTRLDSPMEDEFVEIKPQAYGVNFRDLMVALDQLQSESIGFECAGVVSRVGKIAEAKGFHVGDRVYAVAVDCFATTVRIEYLKVAQLPDWLSFAEGASLPLVHATAYHGLCDVARLRPNETVLIHAASGGVGQSAIMIAKDIGAEIFATVGTAEKREFLKEIYDIPDDHIFSSRDVSFANGVMERTRGKGVDVILNSLGGPLLRASWNCLADFGRFIEIGKRDIELDNNIGLAPFARGTMFAALDLLFMYYKRPMEFFQIVQNISSMVKERKLGPVHPITSFPISEYEKALRFMQEGKHKGKIVLEPREGDLVKVLPPSRPVKLSSEGSYLIVGGLGGIGKSVAQMLVDKGARYLILMSRSAASPSAENAAFLEALQSSGTVVSLKSCDVSQKNDVAQALAECAQSMPPIKGVIQSAMVLRDVLFDQMSHNDYTAAVQAKVQGTWNLHELVPAAPLDYFIMLSSISGVGGNTGQANYAAGGTFQDALAKHRASLGLPAVSLDLGAVNSVGVLADAKNSAVAAQLKKAGLRPLEEAEVLRLIESAIRSPRRTPQSSQIITGIPPGFVRSTSATFWNHDPRFAPLEIIGGADSAGLSGGATAGSGSAKVLLAAVTTVAEAQGVILDIMLTKLAKEFGRAKDDIDPSLALTEIGVDSLISVELRNWIVATLEAECSIFDVMQSPSLTILVDKLVAKSRLVRLASRTDADGATGSAET
ncbi:hypothetical protein BKA67DRAFT_668597 [Truncatella angustata]|uniref:Carrier domain-containing protein n=1 Tax=Truncatella angustata TaxID=152316 RepID=A0A9P8UBU4_9PEZI|nr:uncharacterized protein BKA67DRAFT_668597 [Truncatella angustata]KAH6645861.1 hypothetical protein BKA67DRAFT_668597 [Truncatella angustata]